MPHGKHGSDGIKWFGLAGMLVLEDCVCFKALLCLSVVLLAPMRCTCIKMLGLITLRAPSVLRWVLAVNRGPDNMLHPHLISQL